MNIAARRPHTLWAPVALAGIAGAVVTGAGVIGVVAMHHGGADPAPTAPSAPAGTALIIPIPVAPTHVPTTEVAEMPRVTHAGR